MNALWLAEIGRRAEALCLPGHRISIQLGGVGLVFLASRSDRRKTVNAVEVHSYGSLETMSVRQGFDILERVLATLATM